MRIANPAKAGQYGITIPAAPDEARVTGAQAKETKSAAKTFPRLPLPDVDVLQLHEISFRFFMRFRHSSA
jgi:hypothetical protein